MPYPPLLCAACAARSKSSDQGNAKYCAEATTKKEADGTVMSLDTEKDAGTGYWSHWGNPDEMRRQIQDGPMTIHVDASSLFQQYNSGILKSTK